MIRVSQVTFGVITSATVQFAGLVSPGLYQFNLTLPLTLAGGDKVIAVAYAGSGVQSGVLLPIFAPLAPPTISSMTLSTSTVTAPAVVSCQLILSSAATSGGVDVQLASSNSLFQVPSILRVVEGRTSATFNITVPSLASSQTTVITGSLNGGVRQTAQLTAAPPVPVNPFRDYEITIQAPLTFAGKQVNTKFSVGAFGFLPRAIVDTTADFSTGILLAAYFTEVSFTGNTVRFAVVSGEYNNIFGSGSGSMSAGSLSITATTPTVGSTVTGTMQFSTPSATFTNNFTGRIVSSEKLF